MACPVLCLRDILKAHCYLWFVIIAQTSVCKVLWCRLTSGVGPQVAQTGQVARPRTVPFCMRHCKGGPEPTLEVSSDF